MYYEHLKSKVYIEKNITCHKILHILHFFFISCFLLFTCCLLSSCGKKGEPTLKSYEKPDPPTNFRAINRESEIILLWDFPKDKELSVKGFFVLKSTDDNFEKLTFVESNKRTFIDSDVLIGYEYKYKIISQNFRGVKSSDTSTIEVNPKSPPAPPENLSFTIEHESVKIMWGNAGDGILYNIYKSDKKGIYSLMPFNNKPMKDAFFIDLLNIKKPVYYTVRSLKGGNIRDEGPPSEELEINPSEFIPSAPQDIRAVAMPEKIYLIWKEPPEQWVFGYRVYRQIDSNEEFLMIGETQTPTFTDHENPLQNRNYRITALGPSKESQPAEIKNVGSVKQE